MQTLMQFFIVCRQNLCRQQGRIRRARFTNRQRTDRNPARHLHDGVQAVYAAQRCALHRNT
ncbi:hypothetical protein D3C73_1409280 [compost metagenome]